MGTSVLSLVKPRWLWVAGAGAMALLIPIWLLLPARVAAPEHLAAIVTDMPAVRPAGDLGVASAAPPFAHDRLPAPLPGAPTPPEAQAAAEAAPAPAEPPQLVGVVLPPRGAGVALVKNAGGETVSLSAGGEVDGWQLTRVGRNDAAFARNGESRTVALEYRNRPASAASPAPTAPTPAVSPAGQSLFPPIPKDPRADE